MSLALFKRAASLLAVSLAVCLALCSATACSEADGPRSDEPSKQATGGHESNDDPSHSTGAQSTGGENTDSEIEVPLDKASGGGGTGGTQVSVEDDCAQTEVTAVDETIVQPADIIILVDSSPSMLEEIGFVRENLNAFSQQIIDSGVDARVIMIAEPFPGDDQESTAGICIDAPLGSGSCPDDTNPPHYVHIPERVASSDSLDVLFETASLWKEHVRPDAVRSLFIVSDQDAYYPQSVVFGDPPLWEDIDYMSETFFESLTRVDREYEGPWIVNAVYAMTECADVAGGGLYARLIEETNGIAGDLCEQDFQPIFDRLAQRVLDDAVSLSCEWDIPEAIDGQTFSTNRVQVVRSSSGDSRQELFHVPSQSECRSGAWYFDNPDDPSRVLACPETCDMISHDSEGKIDVVFDCEIVEGCSATAANVLEPIALEGTPQGETTPCSWMMPKAGGNQVVDTDSLNLRYVTENGFGILLGRAESETACAEVTRGWYFDDPNEPTSISACPSTCETLQQAAVEQVQALFGCETRAAVIR